MRESMSGEESRHSTRDVGGCVRDGQCEVHSACAWGETAGMRDVTRLPEDLASCGFVTLPPTLKDARWTSHGSSRLTPTLDS